MFGARPILGTKKSGFDYFLCLCRIEYYESAILNHWSDLSNSSPSEICERHVETGFLKHVFVAACLPPTWHTSSVTRPQSHTSLHRSNSPSCELLHEDFAFSREDVLGARTTVENRSLHVLPLSNTTLVILHWWCRLSAQRGRGKMGKKNFADTIEKTQSTC